MTARLTATTIHANRASLLEPRFTACSASCDHTGDDDAPHGRDGWADNLMAAIRPGTHADPAARVPAARGDVGAAARDHTARLDAHHARPAQLRRIARHAGLV